MLGILLGIADASSAAALLLLSIYESKGIRSAWLFYALLSIIILLRTIFAMPQTFVKG